MGITPAIIGAAAISGGAQAFGASQAADAQSSAAQASAAQQSAMFQQTQANLNPFIQNGTTSMYQLGSLIGTNGGGNPLTAPLTKPFTAADLENTPGYQFTRDQGLQAVQNGFAAKGLGDSGAAMKGAAQYATGLASTTYNQQLQNYLAQNSQIFNMLQGQSTQGSNAATGLGSQSAQVGQNVGNSLIAAGNGQAAGYNGMGAAVSNSANQLGGMAYNYATNPLAQAAYNNLNNASASNIASANNFAMNANDPYAYASGGYTGAGPFLP